MVRQLKPGERCPCCGAVKRKRDKMKLIERLKKGPLNSDHFAHFAKSRKSLHVRIYRLRTEEGYNIVAHPDPRAYGRRSRRVIYELVGD